MNLEEEEDYLSEKEADIYIQRTLAEVSLTYLEEHYKGQWEQSKELQQLFTKWQNDQDNSAKAAISTKDKSIYLNILDRQRVWLIDSNKSDVRLDEQIIRKHLQLVDMEEEKIRLL